ncbi:hypothetical protein [Salinarchaeum laminariae]|uniref:hypothetical protein n=1 Tax=Salinarchaeum laminariae TaxID=869888 RepID=UPI0020BE43DE|nr:hypothetical protein [Salinarchaeum laminariae]
MGTFEDLADADLKFRIVIVPAALVFMLFLLAGWDLFGANSALAYLFAAVPGICTCALMYRLV